MSIQAQLERVAPAAQDWQTKLREAGAEAFARMGFPSRHDEAWRHTPVAAIVGKEFNLAPASAALPEALPEGVTVRSLAEALRTMSEQLAPHLGKIAEERNGFVALSSAFLDDGVFVHVARGVNAGEIELAFAANADGEMSHPRLLLVLEDGACATVVERHAGEGLNNRVCEIVLGAKAQLDHYQVLRSPAFFVGYTAVKVGEAARYEQQTLTLGGALSRSETRAFLSRDAACELRGLGLIRGEQHLDNLAFIAHQATGAMSREQFKNVIDDKATAIFRGHITVEKGAQKTDAAQSNKNLLLSKDASAFSEPHLEIYADDVKCAHGATSGQLETEGLFYLQSRGIDEQQARALLAYAFASELVEKIKPLKLREEMEAHAREWLGGIKL